MGRVEKIVGKGENASKLKGYADDNFIFDGNGRQLSKWVVALLEKEKLLGTSICSFYLSVFKRLLLHTHKNQGLFGKGLKGKKKNLIFRSRKMLNTLIPLPDCHDG